MSNQVKTAFCQELAKNEDDINLAYAALLLAEYLSGPMDTSLYLSQLDEMAEYLISVNVAESDNDEIHIKLSDFGIDKVLGRGKVTKKLIIYGECSETARVKVESEGGRIVT